MENTKKGEFVEIKYTGYSNGQIFDSNIQEDLKKIDEKAEVRETIVIIGQGMVVSGLDKELENKDLNREYDVELNSKDAFGERKKELVRIIPLKMFHQKNIDPKPGMVFALDNSLAKIIAVSGARVSVDFNNPLAGKPVKYKFKIVRKVSDENEKAKTALNLLFRFSPEFEVKDKVIVKGAKALEVFVKAFGDKFKELVGKELGFELKEEKKSEKEESDEAK